MNTAILEQGGQVTKIGSSVIFAIILHLAIIGFFLRTAQYEQFEELLPPPSVVMEISMEAEAEQLTEVNIGQTQALSVASQEQASKAEEVLLPPMAVNEQAEIQVAKTEKKKVKPELKKEKAENKEKRVKELESDKSKASDAPVTSDAAALQKTQRVAAQFNSSSQSNYDAKRQWEAMVLGKLNKFKRYPDDAKRRNRTGTPVVEFDVDPQGNVLMNSLVKKSGTQSLDREAQKVLSRAEPLPPPPAEMIKNGRVTVRIPIDFTIETD
ncbi:MULTISPECIES: energy transducer TonB [Providencia]|uniref:Ferric siderophore transport system periplasmic binding protein n=1 Tax=Providencia heimbachae ATCC 35613 TaxID=1354272 RepID=A0A1B7K454_9GAMM|nr:MULTISPECIES: energy transducer TonB [Providencia]MBP6122294.1 energy transducer TonB [Providencia sp.]NIH22554.1 energy transducer TonB [Providencia heimbachae]OAT54925.1 ferric siderophore transport system periplasmic binding protein [Providencia heimbachae ATCC 35613]SQH13111.1 transport protein TonB [Providencia heimbachae]